MVHELVLTQSRSNAFEVLYSIMKTTMYRLDLDSSGEHSLQDL